MRPAFNLSVEQASAAAQAYDGEVPWAETRVTKTLWPPKAGTKALMRRFGSNLVCVRYRQDPAGRYRYTTVELLVDHATVHHKPRRNQPVLLSVPFWDHDLRALLLSNGAQWQANQQAWRLSRTTAIKLGLQEKIRKRSR